MATAKKKEEGKEVATQEAAGAVGAADYGADAGLGFDNTSSADVLLPYINVLQGLSPACQGKEAKGRPGLFQNSATQEVIDTDVIYMVPAITVHEFVEFKPREAGGGVVAKYKPGAPEIKAAQEFSKIEVGKLKTAEGNEMVESFAIFAILCDENFNPIGECVVPNHSTKIKSYKQWMSRIYSFLLPKAGGGKVKPPLFAHATKITTVEQKHPKGVSFNVKYEPAKGDDITASLLPPNHPAFIQAKKLRDLVLEGKAQADDRNNKNEGGDDDTPF